MKELFISKTFQPKEVAKDWGYELWLVNNKEEDYCGKILYINEGCSTSMHFHSKKHETFYILQGTLRVDVIDTDSTEVDIHSIAEGESFVMERNCPHKLIAQDGPVKFIEISTFHEDSDSYRVKK